MGAMFRCFRDIVREQGVLGLYKGAQSPLAGMALLNAVLFSSGGTGARLVRDEGQHGRLRTTQCLQVGAFAGCSTSLVEGPVDYAKCQLQMRPGAYDGFFGCMRDTVRARGARGLFHGLDVALCRNIPACALFFAVYERTRDGLVDRSPVGQAGPPPARAGAGAGTGAGGDEQQRLVDALPAGKTLLAGGVAGCAFWGFTSPVDVVKSSVQAGSAPGGGGRRYHGAAGCARKIWRAHGWRGSTALVEEQQCEAE
eukprot:g3882.t1